MLSCYYLTEISNVTHARNLGAVFDCNLKMDKFVNAIIKCSSVMYYIRSIAKIHKYLSTKAAKSLIHAFATSRLDYAYSLLYGINSNLLDNLQRLQNAACRVVTGCIHRESVSEHLQSLH